MTTCDPSYNFLLLLIKYGATAILTWAIVWLSAGVAILGLPYHIRKKRFYALLTLCILSTLMTTAVGCILSIMRNQNMWIGRLNNQDISDLFFESRNPVTNVITDCIETPAILYSLLIIHFLLITFVSLLIHGIIKVAWGDC